MCSATHRHPAAARRPGPSGAHACVRGTAAAHGPRGPTRPHGLIGAAAGPHRGGCTSPSADRSCHATPARVRVARRGAAPPAASKRLEAAPGGGPCHGHLSWTASVLGHSGPPTAFWSLATPSPTPPPHPYFQAGEGGGSAPDEGVDLGGLNLVHAAHGLRDLSLVRARVDDEDEGVVVCARLGGP